MIFVFLQMCVGTDSAGGDNDIRVSSDVRGC